MRVVVVGGGVIGLLVAVECVRAGAEVDLVDQAGFPSPQATSNDLHRVVRALHRGDAALTRAGARAHEGWLEVQRLLGARFYHQAGALTVMEAGDVPASMASLAAAGAGSTASTAATAGGADPDAQAGGAETAATAGGADPDAQAGGADPDAQAGGAETAAPAGGAGPAGASNGAGAGTTAARIVPAAELAGRYPQLRLPGGVAAILEPYAGAVLAGQALAAMTRWLDGQPDATLHPGRQVTAVDEGGTVRLADGGVLAGDGVVVAAGPWSRELLPAAVAADLTLYRQTMLSYAPPSGTAQGAWAGTPAVLGLGPGHDAWMMPPVAGTPARLSAASACRVVARMTGRQTPGEWRDHLTGRFAGLLAGFDPAAVTGATDGYYLSAEAIGGPLLAALPGGTVWMYAACGGMSFKFAPLIARALADRALGRPPRPTGLDPVDRPRQLAAAEVLSRAEGHPARAGGPGRRKEMP